MSACRSPRPGSSCPVSSPGPRCRCGRQGAGAIGALAAAASGPDCRRRSAGRHRPRLHWHRASSRRRAGDAGGAARSARPVRHRRPCGHRRQPGGHPCPGTPRGAADLDRATGPRYRRADRPAAGGPAPARADGGGSACPGLRTDRRSAGTAPGTADTALRAGARPPARPDHRRARRAARADRCRRDDRPLHRQARAPALCRSRGQGSRRTPARSALPPRRQPHRRRPRRHGHARSRCEAADPALVRQDRDHRSGLRHRGDDADRHHRRAAGTAADRERAGRGGRAGHRRPRGHPGQPGRWARGLSGGAGALGRPGRGNRPRDRLHLAGALAAARAPAAVAGADRDPGAPARPSADLVHLARHPPPGEARRRPRAGVRRVVGPRCRAGHGAGLFPGRGRGRRALLALPCRRW